ncbi:MAG: hypothetical protein ACK5TR_04030 [Alphaproteobacteria bacterium]|jgi:hypothetical protein
MKKILPFLLLTCLTSGSVFAGHFYNIEDESQLKSGSQLNQAHHMGFSDDTQATLISPRLAISARHGTLGAKDQSYSGFMSFYGKRYEIVRAIEHADVHSDDMFKGLSHDITVFLLKEEVTRPDGGPVACPLGDLDYDQALPSPDQPLFAHTLSQSPFIRLGNFHQTYSNTDFSSLYGKVRLSNYYFTPKPTGENWEENFDFNYGSAALRVTHDYHNPDPTLMLPIGGDSGSACYVRLKSGGYALIGAMARTDDSDTNPMGGGGHYSPTAKNIPWLRDIEDKLIAEGQLDAWHRFEVATQDQWEFGDHTPVDLIPAPRRTTPMGYLALNPDLMALWANLPFQEALAKAEWHLSNFAVGDSRRVYLSQGDGDLSLGTEDTLNAAVYLAFNNDLQDVFGRESTLKGALDAAARHFETSGRKEKRTFMISNTKHRPDIVTLPDMFFPQTYLHLNPDVQEAADRQGIDAHTFAKWHYRYFGFKEEGRRYILETPGDFWSNLLMYVALHRDLKEHMARKDYLATRREARLHYLTRGFMEKRPYSYNGVEKIAPTGFPFVVPEDFDAALYLALHPDIAEQFDEESGGTMDYETLVKKAEEHYRTWGGPVEGRRYR